MTFKPYEFVPNPDSLHCTQASFIMAYEAIGGPRLTMCQAEELTGFLPGVETWPYAMIASFAEAGYTVRHVDAVDAWALTSDPEPELRASGLDADTLAYFLKITDFEREHAFVTRAIATGKATFQVGAPDVTEIPIAFDEGWLPILSLDAAILAGREHTEFEGHVVVVRGHDGDGLILDDPGPPARSGWTVPMAVVSAALKSPAETSGTVTYVRNDGG